MMKAFAVWKYASRQVRRALILSGELQSSIDFKCIAGFMHGHLQPMALIRFTPAGWILMESVDQNHYPPTSLSTANPRKALDLILKEPFTSPVRQVLNPWRHSQSQAQSMMLQARISPVLVRQMWMPISLPRRATSTCLPDRWSLSQVLISVRFPRLFHCR